ncbi:hypothetical protein NUW54_g244 [Trametes sanguinea]|uniref:Uncharacterized protein n=2 Tax=Trametes sanguinea TaxID=158606 RepID=A0ACC1Q7B8_9APHY|nr:hypothetical protein NUW54_g1759 [Trametes sanguinea]KAJ3018823.1 hypothetical protein NUW54_g244 [Trametes sanguinea]
MLFLSQAWTITIPNSHDYIIELHTNPNRHDRLAKYYLYEVIPYIIFLKMDYSRSSTPETVVGYSKGDSRWEIPTPPASPIDDRSPCRLFVLNDDILRELYALLQSMGQLKAISTTCRYIRQTSKPYLFRAARIITHEEIMTGLLFEQEPSDIWLYVRHLTLAGIWRAAYEQIALGALQHPFAEFLSAMPLLHTITVTALHESNGMPWDGVKTLLSVGRLRHFVLRLTPERGVPFPTREDPFPVAPLDSLDYQVRDFSDRTICPVGEISLFDFVIPQLSTSLERLVLPLDSAPLSGLASCQWVRLRELYLKGDLRHNKSSSVPMSSVLAGMPELHTLTLLPAQADDVRRLFYGANDLANDSLCPLLNSLTLAYPHPEDRLFDYISPSLQHISLRCWPRHYLHKFKHERKIIRHRYGRCSPIPTSSDMLAILKKFRSELLEELEIEYQEDDRDDSLLQSLAVLFPNMKALTLFRYRRPHVEEVPVVQIARNLSQHRALRIMRAHLDFHRDTHPYFFVDRNADRDTFESHRQYLKTVAEEFAKHSSPSLEYVCLLTREEWSNIWLPFHVVREDAAPLFLRLDHSSVIYRLSMRDDDAPRQIACYMTLEDLGT